MGYVSSGFCLPPIDVSKRLTVSIKHFEAAWNLLDRPLWRKTATGHEPRLLKRNRPRRFVLRSLLKPGLRAGLVAVHAALSAMRLPPYENSFAFPQIQVHQSMLCVASSTASCSSGVRAWDLNVTGLAGRGEGDRR